MRFWPTVSYISARKALALAAVVATVVVALTHPRSGADLGSATTARIVFKARSLLGADPVVAPQLKIFIVDDPTVAALDRFDPTLGDWATILEALAARKPRAILVDKLFDSPYPTAEAEAFVDRIRALPVPVHAGAFVTKTAIQGRQQVPGSRPDLEYAAFASDAAAVPATGGFLYGARSPTRDALRLGHLIYGGETTVEPLLRLSPEIAVPVIGLAAFSPHFGPLERQLTVARPDGSRAEVPLTSTGALLVNLPSPDKLMARTFNMVALLDYARRKAPITPVAEGDVVVILPAMYTGNTDWHPTPFGTTPGGFVHAAVANSVLTGKWLREFRLDVAGPLLGAAVGLSLALLTWGMTFLGALAALVAIVASVLIATFAFGDVLVYGAGYLLALIATALLVMFERARVARLAQVSVEQDLETARLVQETFLPRRPIASGSLELTAFYRSASTCCGDWWTQFSVGDRYHCVAIGDAVGHGTPAALVTAMAYATFMTVAEEIRAQGREPLPDEILTRFNRVLFDAVRSNYFMSCFVAVFDLERGVLTYSNAGHPFPMLMPSDPQDPRNMALATFTGQNLPVAERRPVIRLRDPGGLLGMEAAVPLRRRSIGIRPGDRLVLFTDGMYECRSSKEEALGFRGFSSLVVKAADVDLAAMQASVVAGVERFIGPKTALEDDMTMLVIDYRAAASRALKSS